MRDDRRRYAPNSSGIQEHSGIATDARKQTFDGHPLRHPARPASGGGPPRSGSEGRSPEAAEQRKETDDVMWYVYFLQLSNGDIYVGSTNDLRQRFSSHQGGHV